MRTHTFLIFGLDGVDFGIRSGAQYFNQHRLVGSWSLTRQQQFHGICVALFTNRPGTLTKLATISSTEYRYFSNFSFKTEFKYGSVSDLMKVV